MDKQELQEMLNGLSETELSNLEDLINKVSKKPRNKRRGSGKRKTNTKVHNKKITSKKSDLINSLDLSPEEQKELKTASQFDQGMGLDKPKVHGIMSKGPTFAKVSIKCMECQKTFEVAPALIPPERDRFRCNTCACRGHG
jgi:hypothetical protein